MNTQNLLGTTTQTIVNNYFLNGNVDVLRGRFKKMLEYPTYLSYSYNGYMGNYEKCDYNAYSMHQPCDRQLLTYIDIEKFRC